MGKKEKNQSSNMNMFPLGYSIKEAFVHGERVQIKKKSHHWAKTAEYTNTDIYTAVQWMTTLVHLFLCYF